MSKIYYKNNGRARKITRFLGLGIFLGGLYIVLYVGFPLVSWQLFFAPAFASQNIQAPIPKTTVLDPAAIGSLIAASVDTATGLDYNNAKNWFPQLKTDNTNGAPRVSSYLLSIPKLGINNATVSTTDYDLARHLINYGGTAIPPDNGNAVIFGHSTLPQLFDPKNYKAIFATAYKLEVGDQILVNVSNVLYTYKIFNITVVDPSDTGMFAQTYDTSYLTIITCTPPGTVWKRLVIKARLQKLS